MATSTEIASPHATFTLSTLSSDYEEPKPSIDLSLPDISSAEDLLLDPLSKDDSSFEEIPSTKQSKSIYTPILLALYDFWILGIVNTFAWGCSTARYLLPLFRANVFGNHLDIGVGSGYYLDKNTIPESTQLTLVDNDPSVLRIGQLRSKRHDATTVVANVLEPLPLSEKFDSISMYYLLHCLPATVQEKCAIFSHIKHNMTADGVIHGANVLGTGVRADNFFAAFIRQIFTNHGMFHNKHDNAYEFEEALRRNFKRVETWTVGSVFLFRAQGPKKSD